MSEFGSSSSGRRAGGGFEPKSPSRVKSSGYAQIQSPGRSPGRMVDRTGQQTPNVVRRARIKETQKDIRYIPVAASKPSDFSGVNGPEDIDDGSGIHIYVYIHIY
jgi:hypothetical protein